MPHITLTVSPLVARLFCARYGDGVVKIHRSDIVYHYLQGDPLVANAHRYRYLQDTLTQSITIDVSILLARRLRSRKRQVLVGQYLHKIYQEEILVFVDAQVKAGVPAQTAMKAWLQENEVQEDDYGLESAYTSWLRRKKFFRNIQKKSVPIVSETDGEHSAPFEVPEDYRDILEATQQHFDIDLVQLLCRPLKTDEAETHEQVEYVPDTRHSIVYARKVLCYVLHVHCCMSARDISGLVKRSRRRIDIYINDIAFALMQYEDTCRDLEAILGKETAAILC